MVTVWCLGGLGNQMFQYAMYRALQLDGYATQLDISRFVQYDLHNGLELFKVFGLNPNYVQAQKSKFAVFMFRLLNKLQVHHYVNHNFYNEERYNRLKPDCNQDLYLYGYWQSEKYFIHHRDVILRDFTFPEETDQYLLQMICKINELNSVSIHVRRGDYVNHPELGGICDINYYQKAIAYIKEKVVNPHFFVFSNDLNWCKDNLPLNSNVTYVNFNTGKNSFRDMQLMSLCKHNIIANSSFSWWGAWLNVNPDKIVVAPSRWFNNIRCDMTDIIPHSWYKVA